MTQLMHGFRCSEVVPESDASGEDSSSESCGSHEEDVAESDGEGDVPLVGTCIDDNEEVQVLEYGGEWCFDDICFLTDLQVLVAATISRADSIPITAPASEPSGPVLSQVPLDSETTHVGQVQVTYNTVVELSELSGSELLFFDSEPTRMGRKRRCRDMSGLSQCLCGEIAKPSDVDSIQCQKDGCETTWVGDSVDFSGSRLNQFSIIFGVSGMRMETRDRDSGLARCAH